MAIEIILMCTFVVNKICWKWLRILHRICWTPRFRWESTWKLPKVRKTFICVQIIANLQFDLEFGSSSGGEIKLFIENKPVTGTADPEPMPVKYVSFAVGGDNTADVYDCDQMLRRPTSMYVLSSAERSHAGLMSVLVILLAVLWSRFDIRWIWITVLNTGRWMSKADNIYLWNKFWKNVSITVFQFSLSRL